MDFFSYQNKLKSTLWGWGLVSPQWILVFVFYLIPIIKVCYDAFFYVDPFGVHTHFAGFQNIIEVVKDTRYLDAIKVTAWIVGWVVLITTCLGVSIALLLQQITRGRTLYKMLLLWPYAVSPAIAAIIWRFIMHPHSGWVSECLSYFHFSFNYLLYPGKAMFVVIMVAVWQQLSYNILFCFVALEAVPKGLLEAATLDGAGAWNRFWHFKLPMIRPTLFFLALMNALYACFDTFSLIDILTAGGPGNQTTTLLYKIYKDGFLGMDWSSAAVQSVILMLLVFLLSGFHALKTEHRGKEG